MKQLTCFCCDKQLDNAGPEDDEHYCMHVSDGGFARLFFGYGSRFDNIECDGSLGGTTDMIIFICDDCFEKKFELVQCWRIHRRSKGKMLDIKSPKERGPMRNPLDVADWL